MGDVIHSSGPAADRSWRATFTRTPGLRERALAEIARVHAVEHPKANVMFPCPICKQYPPAPTPEGTL